MSASPDAAEFLVHCLDLSYGVACAAFLLVALWAVAAELLERRRLHAPLTGPCIPAGGGSGGEGVRP